MTISFMASIVKNGYNYLLCMTAPVKDEGIDHWLKWIARLGLSRSIMISFICYFNLIEATSSKQEWTRLFIDTLYYRCCKEYLVLMVTVLSSMMDDIIVRFDDNGRCIYLLVHLWWDYWWTTHYNLISGDLSIHAATV